MDSKFTSEEWKEWVQSPLTRAYLERLIVIRKELEAENASDAPNWEVYLVNKGQIIAMNDIAEDIKTLGKET